MEGTMGEIRLFAGNFAPLNWAFCNGASMSIAEYTALYALIGTYYGGDGQQTFKLPDLQGRAAVGAGQGLGLSMYYIGESSGIEGITLTTSQMAAHNHATTVTPGTGTSSASVTVNGSDTSGGQTSPGGNYFGKDDAAGATPYVASGTPVAMASGAVTVNNIHGPMPNISLSVAGGSMPHNNLQPSLAMYYIICVEGLFPPRN